MDELGRGWRLLATGFCYALFGLGATVMSVLVFPVVRLTTRDPVTRRTRTRQFIGDSFRFYVWLVERLGVGSVRLAGVEHLADTAGMLVLANHPTLLDYVVHVAALPQANCVVKSALWHNLALGGVVRAAGYLRNDESAELIDSATAALAAGQSLIIYPEGTRSIPGRPLAFRLGAARIALRSRARILPVVMRCEPATLLRGQPWYAIPPRAWRIEMRVLAPVDVATLVGSAALPESIAARHLTRTLEQIFNECVVGDERAGRGTQAADHRISRPGGHPG